MPGLFRSTLAAAIFRDVAAIFPTDAADLRRLHRAGTGPHRERSARAFVYPSPSSEWRRTRQSTPARSSPAILAHGEPLARALALAPALCRRKDPKVLTRLFLARTMAPANARAVPHGRPVHSHRAGDSVVEQFFRGAGVRRYPAVWMSRCGSLCALVGQSGSRGSPRRRQRNPAVARQGERRGVRLLLPIGAPGPGPRRPGFHAGNAPQHRRQRRETLKRCFNRRANAERSRFDSRSLEVAVPVVHMRSSRGSPPSPSLTDSGGRRSHEQVAVSSSRSTETTPFRGRSE